MYVPLPFLTRYSAITCVCSGISGRLIESRNWATESPRFADRDVSRYLLTNLNGSAPHKFVRFPCWKTVSAIWSPV
jgi:hypothetical protein